MSISRNGAEGVGIRFMGVDGSTKLDGDRVGGRTTFKMESQTIPQFGDVSVDGDVSVIGADAAAVGGLTKSMNALGPTPDPMQTFPALEGDVKRLLGSGLEIRFDQVNVALLSFLSTLD